MTIAIEDMDQEIKFLTKSGMRIYILNTIVKQPQTIKELIKSTDITYSTLSSNLNKLEDRNYIRKSGKQYYVNPTTEIYLDSILEFNKTIKLIDEFKEFWNNHNINNIHNNALKNITYLYDSKLIETTPIDIYKTHNTIKEHLLNSKNTKAVFPYLHPDYPEIIEIILLKGGSIEIITNENIYKKLIPLINKDLKNKCMKNGCLKIHSTKRHLNLYLTITNKNMNLGLFKDDGSFDQNRLLTSTNEKAMNWSNNLFNSIKEGW